MKKLLALLGFLLIGASAWAPASAQQTLLTGKCGSASPWNPCMFDGSQWVNFGVLDSATHRYLLAIGLPTPAAGAGLDILGLGLKVTATNPTLVDPSIPFSFPGTGPSNTAASITATYNAGATNGEALVLSTITDGTSSASGAPGALMAGTIVGRDSLDAYAGLFLINNTAGHTPTGAAVWGISRGINTGGTGNNVSLLRGSSEGFSATISAIANNGSGLCRFTVSSTSGLANGDVFQVQGAAGATACNNTDATPLWTASNVTGTTFDAVGSTFSGTYTSGAYATWHQNPDDGLIIFSSAHAANAPYVGAGVVDSLDYGFVVGNKNKTALFPGDVTIPTYPFALVLYDNSKPFNVSNTGYTTIAPGNATDTVAYPPVAMSALAGNASSPITTVDTPGSEFSKWDSVNVGATSDGSNGSALSAVVLSSGSTQGVAQRSYGFGTATSGSVVATYGVAIYDGSSAATPGAGYGGFFNATATGPTASGLALQLNTDNSTGVDRPYSPSSSDPVLVGIDTDAQGANLATAGITIRSGGTNKWDVGLAFGLYNANSIRTATIRDDTTSITTLLDMGAHTNGIDLSGATYTGMPIKFVGTNNGIDFGAGSTIFRMSSDGRLQLTSQSGVVDVNGGLHVQALSGTAQAVCVSAGVLYTHAPGGC